MKRIFKNKKNENVCVKINLLKSEYISLYLMIFSIIKLIQTHNIFYMILINVLMFSLFFKQIIIRFVLYFLTGLQAIIESNDITKKKQILLAILILTQTFLFILSVVFNIKHKLFMSTFILVSILIYSYIKTIICNMPCLLLQFFLDILMSLGLQIGYDIMSYCKNKLNQ